jgi:hypothetical protein
MRWGRHRCRISSWSESIPRADCRAAATAANHWKSGHWARALPPVTAPHALCLAAPVIAAFKARLADAASRANYRPKLGVRYIAEWDFNLVTISSQDGISMPPTAAVLGHNYPGSEWYADAYSLIGPTGEVIYRSCKCSASLNIVSADGLAILDNDLRRAF